MIRALAFGGLLLAQVPESVPEHVTVRLEPARVAVGERVELTLDVAADAGAELRFAEPPELDPALALVERRLVAARGERGRATMTLVLTACAPGPAELGPFALALREADGSSRPLAAEAIAVEITAPWPGQELPPFGDWRRPGAETEWRAWPWFAAAALALVAGAWVAWRRNRRRLHATPSASPAPTRPDRATWRAQLARDPGDDVEACRRWCAEVHALVRAELAARASAAAFAWSREELVAAAGFGAFAAAAPSEWNALLLDLERGMFARASLPRPRAAIAARLAALVDAGSAP